MREAIRPHAGLGSGTKLGLAIARGVAELAGISAGPDRARARHRARGALERGRLDLRRAGSRGRGRRATRRRLSPLVARHPCQSAGGACSPSRSGSRVCLGMLRRDFSVCCKRTGPPSSRGCRCLVLTGAAPGARERRTSTSSAPRSPKSSARSDRCSPRSRAGCSIHLQAAPVVEALHGLGVGAVGQARGGRRCTGSSRVMSALSTWRMGCAGRSAPARRSAWSTSTVEARWWRADEVARQRGLGGRGATRACRWRRHHRRQGSPRRRARRACATRPVRGGGGGRGARPGERGARRSARPPPHRGPRRAWRGGVRAPVRQGRAAWGGRCGRRGAPSWPRSTPWGITLR